MYGLGGHRGIVKTRALSFTLYLVAMVIGILLVPLVLAGPDVVVAVIPDRVGFLAELGTDHVFPAKRIAIASIFARLDRGICAHCTVRVFEECRTLPEPVPPFFAAAPATRPRA